MHHECSWIMVLLRIVKQRKFLTQAYWMGIIHLRSAPMDLKELAVLAMAGLLVKKLSYILFGFLFLFLIFLFSRIGVIQV